jgi:hypothetical protein
MRTWVQEAFSQRAPDARDQCGVEVGQKRVHLQPGGAVEITPVTIIL